MRTGGAPVAPAALDCAVPMEAIDRAAASIRRLWAAIPLAAMDMTRNTELILTATGVPDSLAPRVLRPA